MLKRFEYLILFVGLYSCACGRVDAGDWPQILGPNRNGIAQDENLADQWPEKGLPVRWEAEIGSGFAGVAVSENKAVLFHRVNDDDNLTAFDGQTGERLWSTNFPSAFRPNIVQDNGPRAVPTIHDGAIFAYSAEGNLYCVDLKTGTKRWERDTHKDFSAPSGYFGAGSAPIVENDLVIVNVGGDRMKAGMVAFHLDSGKTVWSVVKDQASYSSPIAVTIGDTRHLLCLTRLNFVSLDPKTGSERFRTPFGQRGPTVNAAIPVVDGDHVLLTASYGIGAQWLKLEAKKVSVDWSGEILSSQYTTPILFDGAVIGVDGRQDGGQCTLTCFNPQSRRVYWTTPLNEYATLIGSGKHLLVMQTNGELRLVKLLKSDYQELRSARVLPGTTRALPALSNGRLYVRNEDRLFCIDLGEH